MKKLILLIFVVLSLFGVVLGGWSFYQDPYAHVVTGIRMVLNGQAGARGVVMETEQAIMISYPTGKDLINQGYVIFSKVSGNPVGEFLTNAGGIGTKVSPKNAQEFFRTLEGIGWKYTTPAAIPSSIRVAVMAKDAIGAVATLRPMIMVIPAGFEYNIYEQEDM